MWFITAFRRFINVREEVLTRLESVERELKSLKLDTTDFYDKLLRHSRGGAHQPGRPPNAPEPDNSQLSLPEGQSEQISSIPSRLGAGKAHLVEKARLLRAKRGF